MTQVEVNKDSLVVKAGAAYTGHKVDSIREFSLAFPS